MTYKTPVVRLISDAEREAEQTTRDFHEIMNDLRPLMRELTQAMRLHDSKIK